MWCNKVICVNKVPCNCWQWMILNWLNMVLKKTNFIELNLFLQDIFSVVLFYNTVHQTPWANTFLPSHLTTELFHIFVSYNSPWNKVEGIWHRHHVYTFFVCLYVLCFLTKTQFLKLSAQDIYCTLTLHYRLILNHIEHITVQRFIWQLDK